MGRDNAVVFFILLFYWKAGQIIELHHKCRIFLVTLHIFGLLVFQLQNSDLCLPLTLQYTPKSLPRRYPDGGNLVKSTATWTENESGLNVLFSLFSYMSRIFCFHSHEVILFLLPVRCQSYWILFHVSLAWRTFY